MTRAVACTCRASPPLWGMDAPLTAHHSLHTTHYTPHTTHYTLHITHSTLNATPFTQHTAHYKLRTTHYTLRTTNYTLHTTHCTLHTTHLTLHTTHYTLLTAHCRKRLFIDNLLVRIHFIIEMIWWTSLAPWEFEFLFPGSIISTFLRQVWLAKHWNTGDSYALKKSRRSPQL